MRGIATRTSVIRKIETTPTIRPATEADLAACARIVNDYIDATAWLPRTQSREELAALFTPELFATRVILVAEIAGAVVGGLSVSKVGFMHGLYVDLPFQRQGIGKLLMDAAKARFPGGLELTVFEPNTGAYRFYEREGFRELPDRRLENPDDDIPLLLMKWGGKS